MDIANWSVERMLRLIAGLFVMLSVALGMLVSAKFFWFTAFVGLNLFQSAFTNWCPMVSLLQAFGFRSCDAPASVRRVIQA